MFVFLAELGIFFLPIFPVVERVIRRGEGGGGIRFGDCYQQIRRRRRRRRSRRRMMVIFGSSGQLAEGRSPSLAGQVSHSTAGTDRNLGAGRGRGETRGIGGAKENERG